MFVVRGIKTVAEQKGFETAYALAKAAGVAINTAANYLETDEVYVGKIDQGFINICKALDVDWKDYVEIESEDMPAGSAIPA